MTASTLRTLHLRVTVHPCAEGWAALLADRLPAEYDAAPRQAIGEDAAEALATLRDKMYQHGIRPVWANALGVSPADREVTAPATTEQLQLFT